MGEPQGHQNCCQKLINAMMCASNHPDAPKKTWGRKCVDCLKPTTDDEPTETETSEGPARETWGNRCTFFISTLGMSVGLGQVWRFPTLAYQKGGGAFLIIYGIMIFFFGNALFFFEVSNGQYASHNPLLVFEKVPLFQGVGWAMIVYAYLFCTYYSHMVSFSIYYMVMSFTARLPWTYCPVETDHPDSYTCFPYPKLRKPDLDGIVCGNDGFSYNHTSLCANGTYANETRTTCCNMAKLNNSKDCDKMFNVATLCKLRQYPSEYYWTHTVNREYRKGDPKYGYLGPFNWWLTLCSFISWLLAYLTLYKGIKSLGVIMYIMVPLPYIVLVIMFGVVIPQNGAVFGLKKFFVPSFRSLYDVTVWRVATEQAFYSIGVAMGPLITFGSYSKFKSPSHIDGALICLCIFLTSVLCSLVVFSVLGFLSIKTGRPFEKVVEAGPGLVFIVYPESLELLPIPQFFSVLFYLMVVNLGMSSVTGIIETVSSAIYDIWPATRKYKYLVNLAVLASCFIIGLPITCRGGLNVYDSFDTYSAGMTLIPICVFELTIIVYIYGLGRFCEDIAYMIGFYPNRYYRYQWMLGPFILLAVFIYGLITFKTPDKRLWVHILGWFLFFCVMGMIPVGMIYNSVKYAKQKNLKNILKCPPDYGPKRESDRAGRAEFSVKRRIW